MPCAHWKAAAVGCRLSSPQTLKTSQVLELAHRSHLQGTRHRAGPPGQVESDLQSLPCLRRGWEPVLKRLFLGRIRITRTLCTFQAISSNTTMLSSILRLYSYVRIRLLVILLRTIWRPPVPSSTANRVVTVPSRDRGRSIKTFLYSPASDGQPSHQARPVLINMHGGGFILGHAGADESFCRQIADEAGYFVFDVEYRLAPWNPFPAALNDVADVVEWIQKQTSTEFDHTKISLSGFSAGGNLALAASSILPTGTIKSVVAFYPPCDLSLGQRSRPPPDPVGKGIPRFVSQLFDDSYCPPGVNRSDPRISPLHIDPINLPNHILLFTCARDNLALAAEELARKIIDTKGKHCEYKRMEQCEHAWNLRPMESGSVQEKAKDEAYALSVKALRRI